MLIDKYITFLFSMFGYTGFMKAETYGLQDGEIVVQPQDVIAVPGSNLTFNCTAYFANSSQIIWIMNNELQSSSVITGPHTSQLNLYNVGIATTLPKRNLVECLAGEYSDGTVMDIGYKPLPQKIECLMQNIDVLHCRWSDNIPKDDKRDEWIHNSEYYAHFEVANYPNVRIHNCSNDFTHMRYCTTLKQTFASYWISHFVIRIRVDSINRIGASTSSIEFHPTNHVVLSPPKLKIKNITNVNNSNVILRIVGISSVESFAILRRHCGVQLQVQYVILPRNTHVQSLQSRIIRQNSVYNALCSQKFWQRWQTFGNVSNTACGGNEKDFFSPVTVTNNSNEVYLQNLSSNQVMLIRARWKIDKNLTKSDRCNGNWSINSDVSVTRSALLSPLSGLNAFLYFQEQYVMNVEEICCEFCCNSGNVLFKQNTSHLNDASLHVVKIEKTRYHPMTYLKVDANETSLCLPTSHSLPGGRIAVYMENEKGVSQTSWFTVPPSASEPCSVHILSVKLLGISFKSLRFKVKWFFNNTQNKCNESIDMDTIKISIFYWKTIGVNYKQSHQAESETNATLQHTVIEIEGNSDIKNNESNISFETRSLSNVNVISSFLFQEHSAYQFAFALSVVKQDNVEQYPATVHPSLFYFKQNRPSSSPCYINSFVVTDTSVRISWSPLDQSARNGPIVKYWVYYTKNMNCMCNKSETCVFVTFNDNCLVNDISRMSVDISVDRSSTGDSWFEESVNNTNLTVVLSNLQPDTAYYIGLVAENQMGENAFPNFIWKKTLPKKSNKTFSVMMVMLGLLCAMIIVIYYKRHKIKNLLLPLVPQPVLSSVVLMDDLEQDDVVEENHVSEKVDAIKIPLFSVADYLQAVYKTKNSNNIQSVPGDLVDATKRSISNQDSMKFKNTHGETTSLLSDGPCCSSRSVSDHCSMEVKEYNERADASDEETFFYSPLEVAMVKQRISTNF